MKRKSPPPAELERPRELSARVLSYIGGNYNVEHDAVGTFLVDQLSNLEDYEIDLILSPAFTPKLTDQAVFAELLGSAPAGREQWPELIKQLAARPVTAKLVTQDGVAHPVKLREVTIERYVHRLRLEAKIPQSVFGLLEKLPQADRPMLKAIARRNVWESPDTAAILETYLRAVIDRGSYTLADAIALLELLESRKPGSLAELIERMKHEAVEQGRRLATEEVVTIMAHDLRSYLSPLKGRIKLLERRACQEGREQDMRDANTVKHTVGLLERVIIDLLDVAHLNQGIFAINAQHMNLMDLVQEVVAAFRTAERPIHVHTPVEVVFTADPDRLRQLLENVLTNAVKHAPKQTPIVVEVHIKRRMDGPWMILTVSNQGPGLPPELLTTFFHPFVAGSQSTGSGLGLYLANRIAAAHGGTLTIDSPAGQGVQMTLALPVEEEELILRMPSREVG